jgi:ankyrin repeat protein
MKPYYLILITTLFLSSCYFDSNDDQLLGDDVRLYKHTPVWDMAKAIEDDDTSSLRDLLTNAPDSILNYQEKRFGQTLIDWAVFTDHYPSVKLLAELGANPNIQEKNGTSAFINAAYNFETSDYLKLLLKYGGDVNAVANIDTPQSARTPLIAACFTRLESVKLLLQAGADVNYNNANHQSPLAAALTQLEIAKYLIEDKKANYKIVIGVTADKDPVTFEDELSSYNFNLGSKEGAKDDSLKVEILNYIDSDEKK